MAATRLAGITSVVKVVTPLDEAADGWDAAASIAVITTLPRGR